MRLEGKHDANRMALCRIKNRYTEQLFTRPSKRPPERPGCVRHFALSDESCRQHAQGPGQGWRERAGGGLHDRGYAEGGVQ